jgi:hypothetical protein
MAARAADRRAVRRRRRAINRVLPLVRAIGADLATDALALLAAGWPAEDVARVVASKGSRTHADE